MTVGEYEDGRPGEVFIKVSKQGSTLAGIMDAFSISISLGLQHGVPLATYVRKYSNMKFEPAGITDDAELRIATSLVDYIFRRLALDYLTYRGAARAGGPLDRGADPADAARRRGERDPLGRPGRRRPEPPAPVGRRRTVAAGATAAGPGRAARRPVLLQLRQRHAAGGLLLRLHQLRVRPAAARSVNSLLRNLEYPGQRSRA